MRKRKTKEQAEAFAMAVRSLIKEPDPGEKGWVCYYCGKEGHLKWNCLQASKLLLAPSLSCKGPH